MSDIFNIIKKSLKNNSFYIPTHKSYVKGSCLSIKQYNHLLEIESELDAGFEQYIKYTVATDKILKDNLESIENLSYFDKSFLLIQIKIAQEKKVLDVSLEDYQKAIIERTEQLNLQNFEKTFTQDNLEIVLGVNNFIDVEKINSSYYTFLNNNFENETDIITLELLKYIKSIKYHGENVYNSSIKDITPLINEFPASLISTFNNTQKNILEELNKLNTFILLEENYIFNPTIEFMLF